MLSINPKKEYDEANEREYREDVKRRLEKAWSKGANLIIPFGYTLGFTGADGLEVTFTLDGDGTFVITHDGTEVISFGANDATFALDNDGRVVGIRLSGRAVTEINMLADVFNFYDGLTDRPLLSAGGGVFTVNGDIAVTGSIVVGDVRWPVALQPKTIYAADGAAIEWAEGSALSDIPNYTIATPAAVALAAGEAFEPPTIQGATTTGGTLRMKISTPTTTSSVTDTTDTAGGGGDPDRVMAKSGTADAYNAVYNIRIQGTMTVTSTYDPDALAYLNDGEVAISPWFNDGGGWDEGPTIYLYPWDIGIPAYTGSSSAGTPSFDVTVPVTWANAIGQHAGYEFGASYESGGSLTDLVSVQYTTQTASGLRTGSPNGEVATILVLPKNI